MINIESHYWNFDMILIPMIRLEMRNNFIKIKSWFDDFNEYFGLQIHLNINWHEFLKNIIRNKSKNVVIQVYWYKVEVLKLIKVKLKWELSKKWWIRELVKLINLTLN